MDRRSSISIKIESRNLDPDALHIELGTQMIMVFFLLHLFGSTKECSFNGHSAVGDDARAGEFTAEIRVGGPFLELIVSVAELFGRPVAIGSAQAGEREVQGKSQSSGMKQGLKDMATYTTSYVQWVMSWRSV